jgi:hypothetical protein
MAKIVEVNRWQPGGFEPGDAGEPTRCEAEFLATSGYSQPSESTSMPNACRRRSPSDSSRNLCGDMFQHRDLSAKAEKQARALAAAS